ncbi:MAG: hypothetical protein MH252_03515 [Thermosynechococcaceae cyanobacterium MS004]|nr:hypothetical protein [Thermosynechococcaceae cyanobacterium MS004]
MSASDRQPSALPIIQTKRDQQTLQGPLLKTLPSNPNLETLTSKPYNDGEG